MASYIKKKKKDPTTFCELSILITGEISVKRLWEVYSVTTQVWKNGVRINKTWPELSTTLKSLFFFSSKSIYFICIRNVFSLKNDLTWTFDFVPFYTCLFLSICYLWLFRKFASLELWHWSHTCSTGYQPFRDSQSFLSALFVNLFYNSIDINTRQKYCYCT